MRVLTSLLVIVLSFTGISQNQIVEDPTITFDGIESGIIEKDQLLQNGRIIFKNCTSNNLTCLQAVDFFFRIVKRNGREIDIETNTCPDQKGWSESRSERYEERMLVKFSKGKKIKCWGGNSFNAKQLRAIRRMKSGEILIISNVKTRASSCSCLSRLWTGLKFTIK